ncbi:ribonuclease H-like domain-containing protein [Mycena maculata]|uniref:DNA polymerase delta catalytic subunit n=1 Tax=Mycena maculata TaxID=230809 RepID=A0AAD7ICU3_9AGAR|nr:ribonuclease H-like domain-containing protein [Mycena maculata]
MTWIRILPMKYTGVDDPEKISHCQLEVTVRYAIFFSSDIELQQNEATPPPLRILSFDIECLGRPDIFPEPESDPVIQIGNMVSLSGKKAPPFVRNVFTLGTCSPIDGADVVCYDDEAALLQGWSEFVRLVDPDLVIGYNITGFDLPYLLARAKVLRVARFLFLGRLKGCTRARTLQYPAAWGHAVRTWEDIPLSGRLQLDLMHYIRCEEQAPRLSLNAVATHFLGEKKEDVHFSAIRGLQIGSADTRRQLAVYCLKDAYLPQRLLETLGCVDKYTSRAREQTVRFNSILPGHDITALTPTVLGPK